MPSTHPSSSIGHTWHCLNRAIRCFAVLAVCTSAPTALELHAEDGSTNQTQQTSTERLARFRKLSSAYCLDCHTGSDAEARLDLKALASEPISKFYRDWRRVERVLDEHSMPPSDSEQPTQEEFAKARASVAVAVEQAVRNAASDPGPAPVRRITNAEYDYCIEDLTGLKLNLGKKLISDSVGGSGFTNSATAQFMQDATLERYLEAAKSVADHAMIGAGPIYFYKDPGLTGLELSAINRIQFIYRQYGFRAAAGEGAEPYGLERFATAFEVAWRYRYRTQIGRPLASLRDLASESGISEEFAQHILSTMNQKNASFPLNQIINSWNAFPPPDAIEGNRNQAIRLKCDALFQEMLVWQHRLSASSGQEEAALLSGRKIDVPATVDFEARAVRPILKSDSVAVSDLSDPNSYSKDGRIQLEIRVEHASRNLGTQPVVVFSNASFRFDLFDGTDLDPVSLKSVMTDAEESALEFGVNPGGARITEDAFVIAVGQKKTIQITLPADVRYGELQLTAKLDDKLGRDSVVRCSIRDITTDYDPQLGVGSREYSALLRDRNSREMDRWESGVSEFARVLPQISHREPTPSDRDPIPRLYDNTYNVPERNYFHTAAKYFRDDDFLQRYVLPNAERANLNNSWTDLLTSFDYHSVNLNFTAKKHGVDLSGIGIDAPPSWLDEFPNEIRPLLLELKSEYDRMQRSLQNAEALHLRNVLEFASKAWRRPLGSSERDNLIAFYHSQRRHNDLDHRAAIRATLVRVLVSLDFLFRMEAIVFEASSPSAPHAESHAQQTKRLNEFELANRLSFSLWSSLPDSELRQSAKQKTLAQDAELRAQVNRLLRSPKSRRMATEFFGQWLGFYQFDQYRGVDIERFPEFDDQCKESLYEEAISFFEYLIREDRPYTDIVQADYTFLNAPAARHYAISLDDSDRLEAPNSDSTLATPSATPLSFRKTNVSHEKRGGLLGLGAVLVSTSAPLRTSPVKRGDWILRRLIGTPVPPPPADVGSIPAEEVLSDGLTVRQRLEAHRSQAECMNCHERIDPLGFSLEHFDSLGRWRETYSDGKEIDATGTFSDGSSISGVSGLRDYIKKRDADFRKTFAAKLVAYCLGRAETLADAALIDEITDALEEDPSISSAVLTLVQSAQFQTRRTDSDNGAITGK